MKKLLITLAAVASVSVAVAQNGPIKQGDVKLGLTLGYEGGLKSNLPGINDNYSLDALGETMLNGLGMGIQGDWFVTNSWAIRFGGTFAYDFQPGHTSVPGTIDGTENSGWDEGDIPNYDAVTSTSYLRWQAYVGMNHYWNVAKVPNLYIYCGFQLGVAHALMQGKADDESSMGVQLGQAYSGSIGFTAGADYYILPSMYVGLEIQPLQYAYSVNGIRPQAGMKMLEADNHSIGFLASPTIKIGFKF